jgi:hypothetical protein
VEADAPTLPSGQKPGTSAPSRLWLASDDDLEVFTGTGNPARDRLPFLLARRAGPEVPFRAVLEPLPAGGETCTFNRRRSRKGGTARYR